MSDERVGLKLDVDSRDAETAAKRVRDLDDAVRRTEAGAGRIDTSMRRAADATRQAGDAAKYGNYQMFAMAQTLDDLQYVPEMGLRPIVNNLMMIAPVAGVAALAVDQLYRHWGQLSELMAGQHSPANEVERLAQNAMKASAATMEMMRAQRQQAEADEKMKTLGTGPSKREKELASAFDQVMKGQDENAVLDALAGTFQGKITRSDRQKLDDASKPIQGFGGAMIQSLRNMALYGRFGTAGDVNQQMQNEVLEKARKSQQDQAKALYTLASQGDLSAIDEMRTRLGSARLAGGGALQSALDIKRKEQEANEAEMADRIQKQDDELREFRRKDLLKEIKAEADAIQFRFSKQSTASLQEHLTSLREQWEKVRKGIIAGLLTPEEGDEIQRSLRDQAANIKDTIQKRGMKPGILENEGPEGFNRAWDQSQEFSDDVQRAWERMQQAQINAMPPGMMQSMARQQFNDGRREAMRAAQRQQRWLNTPEGRRQFDAMREQALAVKDFQEAVDNLKKDPLRAYLW